MRVSITVDRRPEIADPEGTTVLRALHELGFSEVRSVRMDRVIHLEIDADDPDEAKERAEDMCKQLLTNPVLENYEVTVES